MVKTRPGFVRGTHRTQGTGSLHGHNAGLFIDTVRQVYYYANWRDPTAEYSYSEKYDMRPMVRLARLLWPVAHD